MCHTVLIFRHNCTCIQLGLERAKFLIEQAMDEDQQDNLDDAFKMYMEAAELCLKLVRSYSLHLCLLSLLSIGTTQH